MQNSLDFNYYGASFASQQKQKNEDSFLQCPELGLFGVADGMGSPHKYGEIASQLALEVIKTYISESKASQSAEELVVEAAEAAHFVLLQQVANEPELVSMGTTLSFALFYRSLVTIGHVGDSAVFLYRDQKVRSLTSPHHVQEGSRGILRQAVGYQEAIETELVSTEIQRGDIFILCTDGVYGSLYESDLERIFRQTSSLPERADEILRLSLARGSNDDRTIVLVEPTI